MKNKKIIIAGGTGFIGRALATYFGLENDIVILTRNLNETNNSYNNFKLEDGIEQRVKLVKWNGKESGEWCKEIDGSHMVINLSGKSVNCRYTDKNKKAILSSRVDATKAIGMAIKNAINPPSLWINAASATIYRNAIDKPQDEFTGEIQDDFSVQVCKAWEKTFFEQETNNTRKIALRMAITLGNGGVMIPYFNLLKFGLGGMQGTGKQMYSWIHIEDVCRAIDFFENNRELAGVFNISSPNPVSNNDFMKTLRDTTGTAFGLPASKWMMRFGAAIIGTETELILKSRWVVPTKILNYGFTFKYPNLKNAVENIVANTPKSKYKLF